MEFPSTADATVILQNSLVAYLQRKLRLGSLDFQRTRISCGADLKLRSDSKCYSLSSILYYISPKK